MDSDPLDLGRIQQATGHMTHNQPEQQQQTQQQQRQDPSSATPPATPSEDSAPSLSISLAPLEQPAHHFFQWKSPVVGMMPGNISKLNYSPNSLNASPQSSADKRPSPDSTPQMPPWVTARDAPGMMMRQPPPSFPPTPAGFLDLQNNNNNKQNMSSLMEESLLFMDPGTLHPSEDARHMNTTDHPMGPWYAGLMDGHSSSANLQKVEEQSSSTRPISRPINVPVSQQQWMPGSAPMSSQMAGSPQLHHGQTQVGPKSFASMSMDPQWYYQWQLFQQQQQQQQQQLFHQVKRGPGSQVAPQPTHFPLPAPFLMRGQSVPRFICHINNCGKTFTTKQSLKSHAPTHAVEREKPFACSICGASIFRTHNSHLTCI